MKCVALFISSLAVVGAFAPLQAGRSNTQLSESLFDKVCVEKRMRFHAMKDHVSAREVFLK
jgi:hypothetical protein